MLGWNGSAWFAVLAGAALKSAVAVGLAWAAAWLLRGRSAASRHLVWTAVVAAMLALPVLSVSLPALPVLAPNKLLAEASGAVFQTTVVAHDAPSAAVSRGMAPATRAAGKPARRFDWRTGMVWFWAAGFALALARLLAACLWANRARRAAHPFRDPELVHALARELGIRQPVRVLETSGSGMPMTFGMWRPAVLLPSDSASWPDSRRRTVLLHELAHVRRGDAATHLMARVALALNWWNPLAWTAWREFLKERERAADDLVLNAGERAPDYAGHLLEVARRLRTAPATAWAGVCMARPSQLEGRLRAILDSRVNRKSPGRAAAVLAAALAVAAIAPLAALRAQNAELPPDVDATIRAANAQKNHEMLERAASAYENLSKYDEARKLREAALAINAEVSGQQGPDYAASLVKLGELAHRQGKHEDGDAYYRQAIALGDSPVTAPALLGLGISSFGKDNTAAQGYFQRALNADANGPTAGPALTWMARVREDDDPAAAEPLYHQALNLETAPSADRALSLELLVRLTTAQAARADGPTSATLQDAVEMARREALHERIDELLPAQKAKDTATPVQELTAEAQRIRAQRVAELSRPLMMTDTGLQISRDGSGTVPPKLLVKREPEYTPEARALKIEGSVVLQVTIGVDGSARDIKLQKGLGYGLDEAAGAAVSQWRFEPGQRDAAPVPVLATIEVNFRLL
jgi:TonB family protein